MSDNRFDACPYDCCTKHCDETDDLLMDAMELRTRIHDAEVAIRAAEQAVRQVGAFGEAEVDWATLTPALESYRAKYPRTK